MGAPDPTYPLYPIACALAAALLLLVLLPSFIRQNWNLSVTFLCFWLFIENMTSAVNATVWSDNADIKLYVYCDIVTHLQVVTYIVKPMATLIITRRLYLIASLQSVDLTGKATRRRNIILEWTLGLWIPLLVAGPIYYVHQQARFEVDEVFGCTYSVAPSILELLTMDSWTIMPPLISILFFYPKVVRIFYRQSRDIHSFLNSNTSVSRTNYLRILALASVDILLTLPIGIVNVILNVGSYQGKGHIPFYAGWNTLHTHREPTSVLYAEIKAIGTISFARFYFIQWTCPVLAFAIFGLFGVTLEARTLYWRIICRAGGWVGWNSTARARKGQASLGEIEFGARPRDISLGDLEIGSRRSSFVTRIPEAPAIHVARDAECTPALIAQCDLESE
ncbi:STE3-domain-containing protein [Peniophora sp. CONT]|nr:STE3-domain-containing protein [Peniophora sp. CONT]